MIHLPFHRGLALFGGPVALRQKQDVWNVVFAEFGGKTEPSATFLANFFITPKILISCGRSSWHQRRCASTRYFMRPYHIW